MPLITLVQYLQQPRVRDPLPVDGKACREIVELVEQINQMILEGAYVSSGDDEGRGRFSFSPQELNKLSNSLNGIMNYTQILLDEGEHDQDEEVLELLLKVRESSEKMGSILQNKIGGKKKND